MSDVSKRQDRKAATPSRRTSVQGQQQLSNSPNAGTVVYRPSPTQSPAAAQTTVTVIGSAGGGGGSSAEINTTQVGSNNISLQNKVSE